MRNRAKCKLCESIIESLHKHDLVSCKCGEISIDGGPEYYKCSARNFENFLRVDDKGNIIVPTIVEKEKIEEEEPKPVTRDELLQMLDDMVKQYENLPQQAMSLSVTNYELYSFMLLMQKMLATKE